MVAFLNVFLEILVKTFIPKGWATPNGWNQAKPSRLASVPTYFSKIHTQLKAQFGPSGHQYLQGCSSKSSWWTEILGICTKGYKEEVFMGDDEIFKASTRPLYLHLPLPVNPAYMYSLKSTNSIDSLGNHVRILNR